MVVSIAIVLVAIPIVLCLLMLRQIISASTDDMISTFESEMNKNRLEIRRLLEDANTTLEKMEIRAEERASLDRARGTRGL